MILLKKLQLNNFLSHENTSIDFGENEKILIDGASGAGKSSIFEAIVWSLYGQGRSDNRSLVRKGATKCSVSLTVSGYKEGDITITRTATSGGKHTVDIGIERPSGGKEAYPVSGVRETQEWIDRELIGASYILFINSIAYVQGSTDNFVSQSAPKRKELLLEIIKAEDYSKLYEKARQTLSKLDNEASSIGGQITALEAVLASLRASLEDRDILLAETVELNEKINQIDIDISGIEKDYLLQTVLADRIKSTTRALLKATSEYVDADMLLDEKKAKLSSKTFDVTSLEKRKNELTEQLTSEEENSKKRSELVARKPVVIDRNSERTRLMAQIEKLLKQPVCPSGEQCPYSGDHVRQVVDLRGQVDKCDRLMRDEASLLEKWVIEERSLPPVLDSVSVVRELSSISDDLKQAEKDEEIRSEIPELEKKLAICEEARVIAEKEHDVAEGLFNRDDVSKTEEKLKTTKENRNIILSKLAEINARIGSIQKIEDDIKRTEERISELKKTDLTDIQNKAKKVALVKDAFGSKGIETVVIDYVLPKLEDKINEILTKLSDFRVRLDTQKISSSGDTMIEGLWITICNQSGEEMDFNNYSGGEKVRINFAITEAFASLVKARVGWRTVDEAILALDENSLESFMSVAQDLLSSFPQVLFISHIQEIKDLLDKRVIINKTNNTSYVRQ